MTEFDMKMCLNDKVAIFLKLHSVMLFNHLLARTLVPFVQPNLLCFWKDQWSVYASGENLPLSRKASSHRPNAWVIPGTLAVRTGYWIDACWFSRYAKSHSVKNPRVYNQRRPKGPKSLEHFFMAVHPMKIPSCAVQESQTNRERLHLESCHYFSFWSKAHREPGESFHWVQQTLDQTHW